MIVCPYCLQEIESHDGKQRQRKIDAEDPILNGKRQYQYDWCDELWEVSDMTEIS